MSEVVVTRADREAAARLSFASIKRPEIRAYVEAGEGAEDSYCDVHDIATVIAKARAEGVAAGRLAERRDVVAWLRKRPSELRCAMTAGTAMLSAAHHVEAAEHVGAAGEGRGDG